MQGRELTEWEELAGGYAVFCHCLYQPTREKYFQKAEQWLQDKRIKVYAAVEDRAMQKYNQTSLTAQTDGEAVGFYRKVGFTTKEERVQYGTQSVLRYRCLLHK